MFGKGMLPPPPPPAPARLWEDVGCGVQGMGSRTGRYGVQGWRTWGMQERGWGMLDGDVGVQDQDMGVREGV